ncbi:MAG: hypothetical protein Q4B70_13925 [Lachnospiraceae bacterium]|nr:hypothetical protein [Lachnospiraceae bacterium]
MIKQNKNTYINYICVALLLGKPEQACMLEWTKILYIPTVALLLLVLTNDQHQLVFVFPADALIWINDYHYGIGYFLVVIWEIGCAFNAD